MIETSKVVFALLTKVITLYMGSIIIKIRRFDLENLFLTLFLIFELEKLFK